MQVPQHARAWRAKTLVICFASVFLAACNSANQEPSDADIRRAETKRPQNIALLERYERFCMGCHAKPGSGAPLTAFAPAWKGLLAKGMPQLLENAKKGLHGMPVIGMCNDCTDDDMRNLITFMAGKEKL